MTTVPLLFPLPRILLVWLPHLYFLPGYLPISVLLNQDAWQTFTAYKSVILQHRPSLDSLLMEAVGWMEGVSEWHTKSLLFYELVIKFRTNESQAKPQVHANALHLFSSRYCLVCKHPLWSVAGSLLLSSCLILTDLPRSKWEAEGERTWVRKSGSRGVRPPTETVGQI